MPVPVRRLVLVVTLASLGCGRSVLIRRDDATYRRAIAHYQRTRQLVAQTLAPDDDQAIFMQAEGLYRYRFSPPGRGLASLTAQVGASLIDLPVLEAFAGSLDLYSLREKTNDGAVQLWETLLEQAPATPLRPLTLYRLGWAYRSTIASGFPGSSELAFDQLAKSYPDSPLAPLARDAQRVASKSAGAATAWSIVPGLGQMYLGEYGSGSLRLAVALASAAMIVVPAVLAYERSSELSWSHDWPLLVTGVAGATILAIDYSVSYEDAVRGVIEFNERREAEFEDAHPQAP